MTKPFEGIAKLVMELEKQSKLYEAGESCDAMPVKMSDDKPKKKLEKKAEDVNPSAADTPSKQIDPDVESGEVSGEDAPNAPKGGKGTEGELKPKDATEQANIEVKVNQAGNKPLTKDASEVDNVRKELKPLEADEPSSVKVVPEIAGNKPVKDDTPGEQKKTEEPAEKKAAEITGAQYAAQADTQPKAVDTTSLKNQGLNSPAARQDARAAEVKRYGATYMPTTIAHAANVSTPAAVYNPGMEKVQSFTRAIKKAMLLKKIAEAVAPAPARQWTDRDEPIWRGHDDTLPLSLNQIEFADYVPPPRPPPAEPAFESPEEAHRYLTNSDRLYKAQAAGQNPLPTGAGFKFTETLKNMPKTFSDRAYAAADPVITPPKVPNAASPEDVRSSVALGNMAKSIRHSQPAPSTKSGSLVRAIKKAVLLQKIAKVLAADDRPTNLPTEIHAEGSEATTLSGDDSQKATTQASDALGKATKGFTMERSQEKGLDPSALHMERGSRRDTGRDQDSEKIAALIKIAAMKKRANSVNLSPADISSALKFTGATALGGAGLGALLAGKGKRMRGAGKGAVAGTLVGGGISWGTLLGREFGKALGKLHEHAIRKSIYDSERELALAGIGKDRPGATALAELRAALNTRAATGDPELGQVQSFGGNIGQSVGLGLGGLAGAELAHGLVKKYKSEEEDKSSSFNKQATNPKALLQALYSGLVKLPAAMGGAALKTPVGATAAGALTANKVVNKAEPKVALDAPDPVGVSARRHRLALEDASKSTAANKVNAPLSKSDLLRNLGLAAAGVGAAGTLGLGVYGANKLLRKSEGKKKKHNDDQVDAIMG